MPIQINAYVLALALPTFVSTGLALVAWQRRKTPGATALFTLLVALVAWSLEYAMELGSTTLEGKIFWAKLQYISVGTIPAAWLTLILRYTGLSRHLTLPRRAALGTFPALAAFLALTNDSHYLVLRDISLDTTASFPVLQRSFGPGFWFIAVCSYFFLFLASVILIRYLYRRPNFFRGQSAALLIASATPWIGNAIYLSGLSPLPKFLDPTTFLFTISGGAMTWGIFRNQLLDLVPIGHDMVIRSMREGMIILDMNSRVVELNPAAQSMLQKPLDGCIGQHAERAFSEWPTLIHHCQDLPNSSVELTLKTGDEERDFHLTRTTLRSRGQPSGLLLVMQDTTDQARDRRQLAQSEERHRSLIENTMEGFLVGDPETGEILFCNERLGEIFNSTAAELVGANVFEFLDPQEHQRVRALLEAILTEADLPHTREIYSVQRRDGSSTRVEVSTARVISGIRSVFQSVLRDVTEQEQLQKRLERAQKMEAIGALAGGVAHDLNNILSGLVSFPDLILLDMPEDHPLREDIETLKHTGERAAAIVKDLLTLARRGVTNTRVVQLNYVITEYLASLEHTKLMRFHPKVELVVDLAADLLCVKGSQIHLSKAVMNLVTNAAESHTERGLITIKTENRHVTTPTGRQGQVGAGEYVVLSISDTGSGISAVDMEKIFEPFYTKKVMGRSGSGLGMTVVWGTVKDHGGSIDVQSVEGKGSSFTLYFPATLEELAEEVPGRPLTDLQGQGERILVVDDIPEQRKTATLILERLGYRVDAVESGENAVEHLRHQEADLLLLDMIMEPGMDGLATYERILKFRPRQRAIIASGYSESARVERAQALGAGQWVLKPYLLETLGVAVKEELRRPEVEPDH